MDHFGRGLFRIGQSLPESVYLRVVGSLTVSGVTFKLVGGSLGGGGVRLNDHFCKWGEISSSSQVRIL